MNKIKIIADQALDIPKEILDRYDIKVVNLNVAFGDEIVNHYTNKEFYERMRISPVLPKTSCPSPDAFLDEYKAADGDVIVITLSKEISGTYSSASIAKGIFDTEVGGKKVNVVDSTNGSIGSALLAIKTAKLIETGMSYDEVLSNSMSMTERLVHYGMLETLENAVKGGRVSKTKGFVANVLNLKPIIQIEKTVFVVDKARGTKNSIKRMIDILSDKVVELNIKPSILGIAHANDIEKAELVKSMVLEKFNFDEIIIAEIGPIIGTYAAEGGVLISVI